MPHYNDRFDAQNHSRSHAPRQQFQQNKERGVLPQTRESFAGSQSNRQSASSYAAGHAGHSHSSQSNMRQAGMVNTQPIQNRQVNQSQHSSRIQSNRMLSSHATHADAPAAKHHRPVEDSRVSPGRYQSNRVQGSAQARVSSAASNQRAHGASASQHHQTNHNGHGHAQSNRQDQSRTTKKKSGGFLKKVLIALVLLIALAAGLAYAYVNNIAQNLHEGVDENVRAALVETEYTKEPFYMLLMGTDQSQARDDSGEYGIYRADTLMLVRVDCPNKKATIVSLQRDTLVDMGEYGYNKLNAASALGGPAYAIEVVSQLAGVPISHFAVVDLDGFAAIIDAVGGVKVDVPVEINDADAGGYVAAGEQILNGEEALILCRSRHTYDEYGSGDYYRAANQRMVLSALADAILDADIGTIANTVTTLSQYVTTDLELTDIVGIAQSLKGIDMTKDIYTAMMPTHSVYDGSMWYDVVEAEAWEEMLSRIEAGLPPTEEDVVDATGTVMASAGSGNNIGGASANTYLNERSGTVEIQNGNGIEGSSSAAADILAPVGFTLSMSNADSFDYAQTLIVFNDPALRHDAELIAKKLGCGRILLNNGSYNFSTDLLVITGKDFA